MIEGQRRRERKRKRRETREREKMDFWTVGGTVGRKEGWVDEFLNGWGGG